MKQKHYLAIAQAIKKSEVSADGHLLDKCDLVDFLCDILKAENPNFNADKFKEAVK